MNNPALAVPKFLPANFTAVNLLQDILNYPELQELKRFKFKILTSTLQRVTRGRKVLGSIHLTPERDKCLHEYDVVIVIDEIFCACNADKMRPLIYHELCHLFFDHDTMKLSLVGHDIEEFNAVLARFGDWQGEVNALKSAELHYQLKLEV